MLVKMVDERLLELIPKHEFLRLQSKAEASFTKIEKLASESVLQDVIDLLIVLHEFQMYLIEERFHDRYEAYPN